MIIVKWRLIIRKRQPIYFPFAILILHGIPNQAWDSKLGNRSALEWILDQYKEKKPSGPTIAKKFNTYRFADYKEQEIDLLKRVCKVNVETMKIIKQMPE